MNIDVHRAEVNSVHAFARHDETLLHMQQSFVKAMRLKNRGAESGFRSAAVNFF